MSKQEEAMKVLDEMERRFRDHPEGSLGWLLLRISRSAAALGEMGYDSILKARDVADRTAADRDAHIVRYFNS